MVPLTVIQQSNYVYVNMFVGVISYIDYVGHRNIFVCGSNKSIDGSKLFYHGKFFEVRV